MTGARLTLVLACCGWLSCAGASIVKLNKLPFTGEVRRPSRPLSAAPLALLSPPSPPGATRRPHAPVAYLPEPYLCGAGAVALRGADVQVNRR